MEIWETVTRGKYLHTETDAHLRRLLDGSYELTIDITGTGAAVSIGLDKKQLKDLFNALGNELNAWITPPSQASLLPTCEDCRKANCECPWKRGRATNPGA